MKKHFLFTFILLISGLLQVSANDEEEEKRGVLINNESDMLEKITEKVPGVREAIEECDKNLGGAPNKDACVWGKVDQEAVLSALDDYSDGVRTPAGDDEDAPKYEYKQDNYRLEKSESTEKLEAYLKKRLEEALHGENRDPSQLKAAQDHTDFYRVWQSQLGKNLIVQLSSYCMYSNPVSGLVPHRDSDDPPEITSGSNDGPSKDEAASYYRKMNLQNLGNMNAAGDASASFSGFEQCISLVAVDCRRGKGSHSFKTFNPKTNALNATPVDRYHKTNLASQADLLRAMKALPTNEVKTGLAASIPSPCEVNRYMTGVKKALEEAKFLVDEMGKKRENGFQISNLRQRERLNTDKVVNISSGELMEDEDYKNSVTEEAEKLEECASGAGTDCEDYLSDAEENQKIKDESYIRALALQKKIENDLLGADADVDKLKEYFLEKGMSEANFDRMLQKEIAEATARGENTDPVEVLKALVKNYYEEERKAIHNSLVERLNDTEKADPATATGPNPDSGKLGVIKSRIESSPEELATLYHYSNVVSAFINVTGADGTSGKNTAALAAELENNHFDPGNASGRGTASTGPGISSNLEGLQDFAGSDSGNQGDSYSGSSGATLDAEQVDQLQFGLGQEEEQ